MTHSWTTTVRVCVPMMSVCVLIAIVSSFNSIPPLESCSDTNAEFLLRGIDEPSRPWKHLITDKMLAETLEVTGSEFHNESLVIFVSYVSPTSPEYLLVDLVKLGVTLRVTASGVAHTASIDCQVTTPGKYTCQIPLVDPGTYNINVKLMLFGTSEAQIRENAFPNGIPMLNSTYSGRIGLVALPIRNGTFSVTQSRDYVTPNAPWCEFQGFLPGRWDSALKVYRPFTCELPLYTSNMITRWVESSPSTVFIRIQGDSLFHKVFHYLAAVLNCEKHMRTGIFAICFTSKVIVTLETYFIHAVETWPLRVSDMGTMFQDPKCQVEPAVLERLPAGWEKLTPIITFNYFGDHFSAFNRTDVSQASADYMQTLEKVPLPLVTSLGSPSNVLKLLKYPEVLAFGTAAYQSDQHMYQLNEHLIEAYQEFCGSCLGIVDSWSPLFAAEEKLINGDVVHPTSNAPIAYWLNMQMHAFLGTPAILKLLEDV